MNYELIKKLKDAGFPYSPDRVAPINLSELIEACGFPFDLHANQGDYWYAYNSTIAHSEAIKVEGNSPEEAVANLWLKLNTKSL